MCKGIIDKIYQRLTTDKKKEILNQEHPKKRKRETNRYEFGVRNDNIDFVLTSVLLIIA